MQRLMLLTAVVCAQLASAADWKPFNGGEYSISFPGTPTTSSRTDQTGIGPVKSSVVTVELPHQSFTLAITEYPLDLVKKSQPAKMLEGARDGAVANVQGTLDKDIAVQLDSGDPKKKWPGREFTAHTSKAVMASRLYLVNNKLYSLLLVRDQTVTDDADFTRFADSLKLKGPEKPEKPSKKK
jgi:hypothetical protein